MVHRSRVAVDEAMGAPPLRTPHSHAQALYLASGNEHKLEELKGSLTGISWITLHAARSLGGMPEVDENAPDFAGNARLKAEALRAQAAPDDFILADDSGLIVDALGGAPGVRSARYAGEGASDLENNLKLLDALKACPIGQRKARFVCTLVLLGPDLDKTFQGECSGTIDVEERGACGFGYDPLFIPDGYQDSLGLLGESVKHQISHRARAVDQLAAYLTQRF